jgi:ABC-2 type transport system permease protein
MRRFLASSVSGATLVVSLAVVTFVVAVAATAVLLALARPACSYDIPRSLPGVIVGFVIGLVSFLGMGVLIAGLFPTTRSAQGVGLILFFPLVPHLRRRPAARRPSARHA